MITARSPLRISLGGGGTDLASYYEENEGFVISAAIDKYIYVNTGVGNLAYAGRVGIMPEISVLHIS